MAKGNGFKLLITNQSSNERIIRAVIGVIVIGATYFVGSPWFMIGSIIGATLLFNAISGNCYIYRMFGFSTCSIPETD